MVLFAPDDLGIPKGAPSDRRRFLDRAIFTRSASYLATAQAYEKVLKSRNLTLRDDRVSATERENLLGVYDAQLSCLGATIMRQRVQYLEAIHDPLMGAFDAIAKTGMPLRVDYLPETNINPSSQNLEQDLLECLTKSRGQDLARKTTSVGPHRDHLEFTLAGQPAASFASQGQLRAMILAWKTAEMRLLTDTHGDPPVLLLDDVSSELDPARNQYLFRFLRDQNCQCFITTTHPDFVLLNEDRSDFFIQAGEVAAKLHQNP